MIKGELCSVIVFPRVHLRVQGAIVLYLVSMSVQFNRKQSGFLEKSIACQSCGHWSLTERSLSRWSRDWSSRFFSGVPLLNFS